MRSRVFRMLLSFLLFSFAAYSQADSTSDIKIDPRQYVTVQYRKTPTAGKLDTIWNWESRTDVPNQKFHFIDVDGEIKIDFQRINLVKNRDFEGTISLEAEISGINGTRKIEVNPYSEIGVQRIPIGIKSEPPSEIAKKLINMIRELREADSVYNRINHFFGFSNKDKNDRAIILEKYKELTAAISDKEAKLEDLIEDSRSLEEIITGHSMYKFESAKNKRELKGVVDYMISNYNKYYEGERVSFIKLHKQAFLYAASKSDIIVDYLSSFENAGEDATKAFLSLVNKDLISYKALKNTFNSTQKKLSLIDISYREDDYRLDSILLLHASQISETCKSLSQLSRFKGSIFENILLNLASRKNYVFDKNRYATQIQLDDEQKRFYFDLIDRHIEDLSERISEEAGRMIYKKLVYGSIDLGKSGSKNGEVLNVYVTWILDSKRDSLANSPRLPIGKYYLRETGWKVEVADMFALIKRIKESKVDPAKVSPSNFKGSGGAVLMWTFNKQDRGLKISETQSGFRVKKGNRFLNFIEPSFGLNVSYLDFSTEKDVEIGTGLQLGLFRNKIFFGYGVNLHMLSPKNQEPKYFYIGFSFARLSDLFKNSNNVNSMQ